MISQKKFDVVKRIIERIIQMDNSEEFKEEFIILDESYLDEMAELYKNAFAGEPWNDDWSNREQLYEYIKEISGAYNCLNFGLKMDGKLVAMSLGMIRHWWEGTNYNIEELCVMPELQGRGMGSRFMELIENDIQTRGAVGIFLQTDNDKPAYKFYKKIGFGDLGAHVSLYKNINQMNGGRGK
jgi:aminoglycoside 6'-N-acetyltransferase I